MRVTWSGITLFTVSALLGLAGSEPPEESIAADMTARNGATTSIPNSDRDNSEDNSPGYTAAPCLWNLCEGCVESRVVPAETQTAFLPHWQTQMESNGDGQFKWSSWDASPTEWYCTRCVPGLMADAAARPAEEMEPENRSTVNASQMESPGRPGAELEARSVGAQPAGSISWDRSSGRRLHSSCMKLAI
ncbi:hypothetical protein P4O66_005738 [Electrophorus voltai]|uniref:Secreted protein n=1 Tax=Electrophorus voltai TaxID=2609070 RepID=A0AAD8ZJE0_9TELE|nr:hypothetical protein P4O66_005738 [Electrophorus voltai]